MTSKRLLLGVCGGIAAYKAAYLIRLLVQDGWEVKVVMTGHATQFISPLTLGTLARNRVYVEQFPENPRDMEHIDLADWAEVCLVMPATANLLGKYANGLADDLLSTTLITLECPVVLAPGMNTRMWNHPAVQANLATLKARGVTIVPPEVGDLACRTVGVGKVPEMEFLVEYAEAACSPKDLAGKTVVVTAGPTREWLDPFRFLSNPSSGKMGFAIAREAARRGATVHLISGPVGIPPPALVEQVSVEAALEMEKEVAKVYPKTDIMVMAAAVADFRPSSRAEHKIKKRDGIPAQELSPNPDILGSLGQRKGNTILVGFSAESRDLVNYARQKLNEKNLDMIVLNDITEEGSGFGTETNRVTFLFPDGRSEELPRLAKREVAKRLFDAVLNLKVRK